MFFFLFLQSKTDRLQNIEFDSRWIWWKEMVCNICIVRMITFLEDDPLSRQRIQPYKKWIKHQLHIPWVSQILDNKRLFEKSQQFGNGVRYLPPPKRVPFAAPNVENSTDKGIRTAAAPRTRSPHVYKQTNIQYRHVNERLCTLF